LDITLDIVNKGVSVVRLDLIENYNFQEKTINTRDSLLAMSIRNNRANDITKVIQTYYGYYD